MRTIKGILNKLTPEKFERLLQQLLEVITTADILKQTITMVFENAVEQPTYCAMYADLCLRLSKELPSFPPPAGSDKVVSFRQILLNTCQDEFEGTEQAREVRLLAPGPRGLRLGRAGGGGGAGAPRSANEATGSRQDPAGARRASDPATAPLAPQQRRGRVRH